VYNNKDMILGKLVKSTVVVHNIIHKLLFFILYGNQSNI